MNMLMTQRPQINRTADLRQEYMEKKSGCFKNSLHVIDQQLETERKQTQQTKIFRSKPSREMRNQAGGSQHFSHQHI
jgi:hypothetical protein